MGGFGGGSGWQSMKTRSFLTRGSQSLEFHRDPPANFTAKLWETDLYPVPVPGGNCALPIRVPNCSPVLDKILAPIGPEILSSTRAGVWRKVSVAFPDSTSVLDKFLSRPSWALFFAKYLS